MKQKAYTFAIGIALFGVLLLILPLIIAGEGWTFAQIKSEVDKEYAIFKRELYQVFEGIDSSNIVENEQALREEITKQLQDMLAKSDVRAENRSFLVVLENPARLQGYVDTIIENLKELAKGEAGHIKNPYTEAFLSFGREIVSPLSLYRVLDAYYNGDDILLMFLQNDLFITIQDFKLVIAIAKALLLLPLLTLFFVLLKRPFLAICSTLLSGIGIFPFLIYGEFSLLYGAPSTIKLYGQAIPIIRVYYAHMLYPVLMFFACIAFWVEKGRNNRLEQEESAV